MNLADGLADPRPQDKEISHPPIPELSRIAWTASSNIDSARNETRPIYRLPPETLVLIIDFYQLEQFEGHHSGAYRWVGLMLVSRMWKATILSFPSLWSRLVLRTSIPQSNMVTLVDRSGSHPLQMVIPSASSQVYRRSDRRKHIELAIKLLPRISRLAIDTCSAYDASRVYDMFRGRTADQLWELNLKAPYSEEVVLYAPRLRSLFLSRTNSWSLPLSENVTHIILDFNLNPEALERGLKNSPRLKKLSINYVRRVVERPGDHPKFPLLPGVRLAIRNSEKTVVSLFALGPTNHLSVTKTIGGYAFQRAPFLGLALPQDISYLRNLDDPTTIHLRLTETEDRWVGRIITVALKSSTADRETLQVELKNVSIHMDSDPTEIETIPNRMPTITPGMAAVGYLRPLRLGKVVELRMDGFVGGWEIQTSELRYFLGQMPALRRITTSDDSTEMFSLALGTMAHSVVIERV